MSGQQFLFSGEQFSDLGATQQVQPKVSTSDAQAKPQETAEASHKSGVVARAWTRPPKGASNL